MKHRIYLVFLGMLAGWVNRHQQDIIEYLKEENRILREKLGKKTSVAQRRPATPIGGIGQNAGA